MESRGPMGGAWRVGLGGMSCECCTFTAAASGPDDFVVTRGDALRATYAFLARREIELVPLLRARALPGGSVERTFYEATKRDLVRAVADGGPFDGLLLPMHGALHVQGLEDAEGDLLSALREAAGAECIISASYDLHGNVSSAVMRSVDLLTAYRTAPHVDVESTVRRAAALLVAALRRGRPPAHAFVPLPVLLPGEKTSTEWNPGDRLYAAIPELIARHGLLDASILMGYPWADEPRAGASIVTLAWDVGAARRAAGELAQALWDARMDFRFGVEAGTADECLRRATAALAAPPSARPVIVSDSGDNPTAGGAGDVPSVLERMLAHELTDALFVSLADPAAVAACRLAGPGERADLALGGKTDPRHGSPLSASAEVVSLHEAPLSIAAGPELPNAIAVVRVGGVLVVVTERRTPFHRLDDFLRIGIDPRVFSIVVVKIGYLEPELKEMAARAFLALSPGAVDQNLASLPYSRIRRPMFPLDPDAAWSAAEEIVS